MGQTPDPEPLPHIVAITGPTAVGKSAVALDLAPRFGAEIVSVDSRQIFRMLDIGTAKPTPEERAAVPHHLIDVVDPDESYSAADFQADTDRILRDLAARGRIAFLVGGSYHYLQAVLERLEIPPVPPQPDFREEMESYARERGHVELHRMLREVDPEGADQIQATNVRRVIRALEVHRVTGVPFSEIGRKRGVPIPALRLGITTDRESLYRRIDDRVDQQISDGLIEEARRVLEMGYAPTLPPLAGLVYREAIAYLRGEMDMETATRRMKETTHAFVRRQYTRFRRDPAIQWFQWGPDVVDAVSDTIAQYLRSRQLTADS